MKPMYRILSGTIGLMLIIMMSHAIIAQNIMQVTLTQAQMSKGMQPCYNVAIPNADLNTVQKNLIKKIQENNKVKFIEQDMELQFLGLVKKELTNDSINIYCLIIQKDTLIEINMFVESDSVFFKPNEDKTDLASDKIDNSIRNYLLSFANEQYRLVVKKELDAEENLLANKQDELEKLVKEEENLKKENASLENDIDEYEREVTEIEKNIEAKNDEITKHTLFMQTIVLEEDKKAAEDNHKDLEKEKKQLVKDRGKAKDDISSSKSKIEKNNKTINENLELQEQKKLEIESQQEVVLQVQKKLEGIK